MTDSIEETTTTVEEETTELETVAADPPPFLRIMGNYPTDGYRSETITLELNLKDDEALGDYDPNDATAVQSWLTDFCVQTIGALRYGQRPQLVTIHNQTISPGADAAVRDHIARAGHAGSDRWTGGDRKDSE